MADQVNEIVENIRLKEGVPLSTILPLMDVMRERKRQVEREGYDRAHDDHHDKGEIALAAAAYAIAAASTDIATLAPAIKTWPWHKREFRPVNARHDLVRAGALILAEIERLDRTAAKVR